MAHHKSAKKRIRTSERKRITNKNAISEIKTLTKKVLAADDKTAAEADYKKAISTLDKNVTKGRIHRNTASRKKAALTKHLNTLSTAAPAPKTK